MARKNAQSGTGASNHIMVAGAYARTLQRQQAAKAVVVGLARGLDEPSESLKPLPFKVDIKMM